MGHRSTQMKCKEMALDLSVRICAPSVADLSTWVLKQLLSRQAACALRAIIVTMCIMAPKFVRAHIRQMDGYTPGEQPGAGERVVKLNTNENPYPPSPRVMQAIREIEPEMLRRYPN